MADINVVIEIVNLIFHPPLLRIAELVPCVVNIESPRPQETAGQGSAVSDQDYETIIQ